MRSWEAVALGAVWAVILVVIGLRIGLWARASSTSPIYRLLRARAALMWGERTDRFMAVSGVMMAVWGLAGLIGIW